MSREYGRLRDPNAEYTMRNLSAETMGVTRSRGGGRDVEITDVQTTMVDGNFPWTLVRVYTDAGVVGTGEAYWGAGVPELIDRMTPFLVGENPLDIDRLYEHLIQKMSGEGSVEGVTVTAIAGIEVALHDLAGKILELPAYQLLGGKYRDEVRVYNDCHTEAEADPEACADEAERVVEELGYDALKFDLDVPSGHEKDRANRHLRRPEIDHKVEIVEAVTERVGDRADVAFDCHWTYSGGSARRLADALEAYDVWWLEDPVPPENLEVQREVTRSTTTPIAAGENRYRVTEHRRLLEDQAVDIVAPDLPKVGGMRETRKIADVANQYYVPVAMHNVASPVATMASAQVGAAIPNALAVEFHSYELDWWGDLVEEDVIEDGSITIPEEPGLGVTLDMDAVAEHMVDGEELFDEL
ncbi:mandelate racemase/muconate lactonizing enzyme family protein [Halapricum hydrolyticum]|uniref:Mandelate racemase/muconate lactonizing enzyme family protein n=1 Tax=Halapricum hydrolyticum TaxID=2979991 RepID=A0AAE3IBJ6_9EURY|nr:mandelate racemase/muconate lactonizing enzyme family protein [Halapricum hydrolyticum]MCU4717957.1 mandelate racemase/muconate lactonizing enzyme family protein [Halapricum hydrolyticum]MCU4727122.1 mandelate racemase/muconate lactonizing enzyme family protein [Halapricum hydrolyticum]